MTTTLPRIDLARIEADARKAEQAASAYVRLTLAFAWPGSSRAVKGGLRDEIVDGLEAAAEAVSASTRMWNWRNPALSAARELRAEIVAFVKGHTIAMPGEPGVRLLPKAKLDRFEKRMQDFVSLLAEAAVEVQADRDAIVDEAKNQRGRAFDANDYPADLAALFGLSWSYGVLTVSEELRNISQTAYAAEQTRQTARLLGAVRMAEEMAVRELHEMAGKLAARLEALDAPLSEGEARLPISEGMVEALAEFCGRFGNVVKWGCDDLEEIVNEAGGAIAGLDARDLKQDRETRQEVGESLARAAKKLEEIAPELAAQKYAGTTQRARTVRQISALPVAS